MKTFVTLFCVLMIPLTLASNTQHRFKVYVHVYGDDNQAISTIESHLKRELRLLGDVDVVGRNDGWEFILGVAVMGVQFKDGRKSGSFAIGTYTANRLHALYYISRESYQIMQATWGGTVATAYFHDSDLPQFCIQHVNNFDKDRLESTRKFIKKEQR